MKNDISKQLKKLPDNEIVFYRSQDGMVHVEVMYAEENIWLNQAAMAELFGTTKQNVSLHVKNIFFDNELAKKAVVKDFLTTASDGKKYNTKFYSLEVIIAVGYRVHSERGREFRAWATEVLKGYIHKGYVLDGDRMKYGSRFSTRYFEELYEEIRDIRTSERMMYQKITDIYATAFDYSSSAPETKEFFATVQNKLHFAITGKTAAEIIADRADSRKTAMGWQRHWH